MKFRKKSSAARVSPKMELLRQPPSGNNRVSNFKRSKSFRASVKLISKLRNHANLHAVPSYDLPPLAESPKDCKITRAKIRKFSLACEEIDGLADLSRRTIDSERPTTRGRGRSEEPDALGEDFESKLSLGGDVALGPVAASERDRAAAGAAIKVEDFNAYENPTFVDSSFDSSLSGFFHEDNLERPEERERSPPVAELAPSRSDDGAGVGGKGPCEDQLVIVVENAGRVCREHRWCSFASTDANGNRPREGSKMEGKRSERVARGCEKSSGGKRSAPRRKGRKKSVERESKFYVNSKFAKSRSAERLTSGAAEVVADSFVKNSGTKANTRDSQLNSSTRGIIQHSNNLGTKLPSLQGLEFLEGFGKKKQQVQRNQQRSNSFTSLHSNSLTAQSSLSIHLHALFAAVEFGHLDKAKAILESTDVNVNSLNNDGFSPLDVAVLSNNRPLAKMLVTFGAQEGNKFKSPETLGNHLASLLSEAEHRVQELGGVGAAPGGPRGLLEPPHQATTAPSHHRGSFSALHQQYNNPTTGCGGGGASGSAAEEKQLALWERRARALRKMLLGFDQARPPDLPFLVSVDVTSTSSVTARFHESEPPDSSICTKFKIQWSVKEDFGIVCGERELLDTKQRELRVDGLQQSQKYYFRAAAGNLKGYSRFRPTTPAHLTLSSWRDIDGRTARFAGRLEQLDSLFGDVRGAEYCQETPALQRRNHKKKTTIKQLFTATSKFQKNLRRGVFLACLLYHEDKVLVTNEDFLPVIEVDETYQSCIYNDFHWFMKVACTWDDVKSLKQDMEKSHGSSTNHFRIKLLQAATQMQAALCVQDLGQFYHKPIRDTQGTLVFSTVNCVKSPKMVSVLNSRWLPLSKVIKKIMTHEDSNVAEILMASIQDQITYHRVSSIKLSRGLYLGYLKMQSSVDSIQVVVPAKSPNILPHCKVRDNPHVSAEEWDYLKRMARLQALGCDADDEEKENASDEPTGTEQQKLFVDSVATAARRLFNYMDIGAEESFVHRLYDSEVIELNPDVSILVAVPPAETACSVPGTREILLQRGDLLSLPVQVFEMVHLNTYQKDVINRYSRLSCILELDTAQAQHNHREAFSTAELNIAKDKLSRLQDLQSQMNTVWKGARWLIDVITFARDRGTTTQSSAGICIKHLLSLDRNKNDSCNSGSNNGLKRSLLQLPPRDPKLVKSSPGRGSWPGPSVAKPSCCSATNLLGAELSKSEQQLPCSAYLRKGSNSSNCSSASEPYKSVGSTSCGGDSGSCRLPPSKSEDTLLLGKHAHSTPRSRSSATSASTSPLLGQSTALKPVVASSAESIHSFGSGNYDEQQPLVSIKSKVSKPTASVAAIAVDRQIAEDETETANATGSINVLPGILQVYAAYETGLASGTSLKLHVTPRTTAREVVDLVVNQLNMAVRLKGLQGPVYLPSELSNFCLVAVIGARERCLRDDFKPLQLQNPWTSGRLYVRQKQNVLAALEHSSKHTAYL